MLRWLGRGDEMGGWMGGFFLFSGGVEKASQCVGQIMLGWNGLSLIYIEARFPLWLSGFTN